MCSYIINDNSNRLDVYFKTNIYTKNGKYIYGKVKKYYNCRCRYNSNINDKSHYETLQFILTKTSSKVLKNNFINDFKWNWENKIIHRNSSIIPVYKIGKIKKRSRPIILDNLHYNLNKLIFISKEEYKLKLGIIKYIPKLILLIKYVNMNFIIDFKFIVKHIKSYLF